MSRTEAKRRFTLDDHAKATAGVECRKDADVIDETPMAYKSIDAVMEAQRDLVDVVHTLRQVVRKRMRATADSRHAAEDEGLARPQTVKAEVICCLRRGRRRRYS